MRRPAPPRASSGRGRAAGRRRAAGPAARRPARLPPTAAQPVLGLGPGQAVGVDAVSGDRGRSTHTDPPRTARTARATASVTDGRRSPRPASVTRWRHVDVGGVDARPASVEVREQPGCAQGEPMVLGVVALGDDVMIRLPAGRDHAVEQVGQRDDERGRRRPAEHTGRVPVDDGVSRAAHAAQVEVEHAAEVACGVVAGLPPAQVAVHHDDVEQRLQRIVGVQHRRGQPVAARSRRRSAAGPGRRAGWSCSRRRGSGARPERRSGAPRRSSRRGSRAATGRRGRRPSSRSAYGSSGSSAGRCWRSRAPRPPAVRPGRRRSPPASGISKSSSRSRSGSPIWPRVRPGASGPSGVWCSGTGRWPGHRRRLDRPPGEVLAASAAQLGDEVVGVRVGRLEHRVHERAERRPRGQIGHRRGNSRRLAAARLVDHRDLARPRRRGARPRARCRRRPTPPPARISPE